MSTVVEDLMNVKSRKHIVTSIEYDCPSAAAQDEVFDAVREILVDNLDGFSKITYDIDPSGEKVKVEVSESRAK